MAAFGSGTTTTAADGAVLERRAADVAVLGSSSVALAAAYSLARRGKKVRTSSTLRQRLDTGRRGY